MSKIPGAVWWIVIPTLIAAITPVIAQFYPTDKVFWSALVVAIGGAIVAALNAWRQQAQAPAAPPPGVAADVAPMQKRSFVSVWLWGGR